MSVLPNSKPYPVASDGARCAWCDEEIDENATVKFGDVRAYLDTAIEPPEARLIITMDCGSCGKPLRIDECHFTDESRGVSDYYGTVEPERTELDRRYLRIKGAAA